MAGVLTNVIKGSMLGNADIRLSCRKDAGETPAAYLDRLVELRQWFVDGLPHDQHGVKRATHGKDEKVISPGQEPHAKDEFFGTDPKKCFFPNLLGDVEDQIVRGAYIRAIEQAIANPNIEPDGSPVPKPIVSYWIVTGREDGKLDCFEAFVALSGLEVHVLLLTPDPVNVPKPPANGIPEDMVVVSSNDRIKVIKDGYPAGYPNTEFPLAGTHGVGCLLVAGY